MMSVTPGEVGGNIFFVSTQMRCDSPLQNDQKYVFWNFIKRLFERFALEKSDYVRDSVSSIWAKKGKPLQNKQ